MYMKTNVQCTFSIGSYYMVMPPIKYIVYLAKQVDIESSIGLGLWCLTPLSTIFQL